MENGWAQEDSWENNWGTVIRQGQQLGHRTTGERTAGDSTSTTDRTAGAQEDGWENSWDTVLSRDRFIGGGKFAQNECQC